MRKDYKIYSVDTQNKCTKCIDDTFFPYDNSVVCIHCKNTRIEPVHPFKFIRVQHHGKTLDATFETFTNNDDKFLVRFSGNDGTHLIGSYADWFYYVGENSVEIQGIRWRVIKVFGQTTEFKYRRRQLLRSRIVELEQKISETYNELSFFKDAFNRLEKSFK